MESKPKFGPFLFNETTDLHEHKAQLRTLATLVYVYRLDQWPINELITLLRKAEFCSDYLEPARRQFDALPSLQQRRIIGTFHSITRWRSSDDIALSVAKSS